MASKAAASRATKATVAGRGSKALPKTPGAGSVTTGATSPLGVNARLGTAGAAAPNLASSPNYATPAAMGAVTPIAAPPVVQDPFLTPTDLANQALELSDVQGYLDSVDLNVGNARVDAQQRLAATDTAEQRNLEAADWNTAARGLAQSSVRDTTKANLSADAAQSRGGTKASLGLAEGYAAGEHQRADTVIRPAINQKYNEAAKRNAQDTTDNSPPPPGGPKPPAAPTGPTGPTVVSQQRQPASAPGAGTSIQQQPSSSPGEQWKPVVKDGKFYHYYPSTGEYVYIRKAA